VWHMSETSSGGGGDRTERPTLAYIREHRKLLMQRMDRLSERQRVLDMEFLAIVDEFSKLHAICDHPNDVRSRPYGPYSDKEWNCPDCGRTKQ
jgi:hypothetical protein